MIGDYFLDETFVDFTPLDLIHSNKRPAIDIVSLFPCCWHAHADQHPMGSRAYLSIQTSERFLDQKRLVQ